MILKTYTRTGRTKDTTEYEFEQFMGLDGDGIIQFVVKDSDEDDNTNVIDIRLTQTEFEQIAKYFIGLKK